METIEATTMDLLGGLTATKEQQTKVAPVNTKVWAEWLGIEVVDDEVKRMVDAAARWATAVKREESPRWLSLLGTSGSGKTHIAKRLWRWCQRRDDFEGRNQYNPSFIYWPKFLDDMKTDMHLSAKYQDMNRWRYLCLDDVLAERQSDWTAEKINTLANVRVGKWTILTSNLSMVQIAQADNRIASRMVRNNGIVADVDTQDYNLR